MKRGELKSQRGSVLIITLGVLAIINVLLWAILQTVAIDRKITYNVTRNQQAILATDAALILAEQAMLQSAEQFPPIELGLISGIFDLSEAELATFSFLKGEVIPGEEGSFQYQVECLGTAKQAQHKIRALLAYDALTQTVTLISYEDI